MRSIEEIVCEVLAQTGIEVTQRPVTGTADRYFTFNLNMGTLERYASNRAGRVAHTITIDLFAREDPIAREIIDIVMLLHENGFTVSGWGSADYESDTGWYHVPITCAYAQAIE